MRTHLDTFSFAGIINIRKNRCIRIALNFDQIGLEIDLDVSFVCNLPQRIGKIFAAENRGQRRIVHDVGLLSLIHFT